MDFDNWLIMFLALFALIELIYICYFWTRHRRLLNDLIRSENDNNILANWINELKHKAARVAKENIELHERLKQLECGTRNDLNIKE